MRTLAAIVVMTVALGFSTAAAFFAVGGRVALLGTSVLSREWPAIYGLLGLFAVGVGLLFGTACSSWPPRRIVLVILGGWIGEYLVLASGLLALELNPLNSLYYWLLATAGPMQPVLAWIGALAGQRVRRRTAGEAQRLT